MIKKRKGKLEGKNMKNNLHKRKQAIYDLIDIYGYTDILSAKLKDLLIEENEIYLCTLMSKGKIKTINTSSQTTKSKKSLVDIGLLVYAISILLSFLILIPMAYFTRNLFFMYLFIFIIFALLIFLFVLHVYNVIFRDS